MRVFLSRHKLGRFDAQCLCDLAKDGDGRGHLGTFDCSDMADAEARTVGHFLLRQLLAMTDSTHIDRHDLLEIHDASGT